MATRRPKNSLTVVIGARLRAARQSRGALQKELARVMGVTQGAVSNYEIGLSDIPVAALLRALDYLNCPPGEFFSGIWPSIGVLGSDRDFVAVERDPDRFRG